MDDLGSKYGGNVFAKEAFRIPIDEIAHIGGDVTDHPVGGSGNEKPEFLDPSQKVNRFAVAIAQVNSATGRRCLIHFRRNLQKVNDAATPGLPLN